MVNVVQLLWDRVRGSNGRRLQLDDASQDIALMSNYKDVEEAEVVQDSTNHAENTSTTAHTDDRSTTYAQGIPKRSEVWLDGLRGLASLGVFMEHLVVHFYKPSKDIRFWHLPFIRSYFAGRTGLTMFFIASGYGLSLKTLSLIRKDQQSAVGPAVASSMLRRPLRLYLPVLASNLIYFFIVTYQTWPPTFSSARGFLLDCDGVLNLFRFRYDHTEAPPVYNAVTWSIPVEMLSSLFLYLVLILVTIFKPFRTRFFCVGMLALYALSHRNWGIACFFTGMIIADASLEYPLEDEEEQVGTPRSQWSWHILCLIGVYFIGANYDEPSNFGHLVMRRLTPSRWGYEPDRWYAILSGLFIFVSISRSLVLRRLLNSSFCQFYGRISYSLYLVHNQVILLGVIRLTQHLRSIGMHIYVIFIISFTLALSISTLGAIIFNVIVDKPSTTIAVKFAKWVSGQCG